MEDTKNLVNVGGTWYLRATVNGATIKQSLRTRNLKEAQKLRDASLASLRANADEKAMLKSVARQLAGIEAKEAALEKSDLKGLKICDLWKRHSSDPSVNVGESMMRSRNSYWDRFVAWLRREHPEIQYCRQVKPSIGKEYSFFLASECNTSGTFNYAVSAIRQVFRTACDLDDDLSDPFSKVRPMKGDDEVVREPFTDAELRKMFASDDSEMAFLTAVGLYTTQRFGVARKLKWENFSGDLSMLVATHEKTGADGTMVVPSQLREWLEKTPVSERSGYLFPGMAEKLPAKASDTYREWLESMGIATRRKVKCRNGTTRIASIKGFHSLRHTAITFALRNGAKSKGVGRLAGHSTEQMQSRYTHLGAEDAGEASAMIGKFW